MREALAGPHTAEVLFHAGMIELGAGHRQRARQLLDQALSVNPVFDPIQAREARDAWLALAPPAGRSTSAAPPVGEGG